MRLIAASHKIMKPTLQLQLSPHLTLTPQLQQSIRLLQLSTLELNQEIERMVQENPLLEMDDGADQSGTEYQDTQLKGQLKSLPSNLSESYCHIPCVHSSPQYTHSRHPVFVGN